MHWNIGRFNFPIPCFEELRRAVFIFKRRLSEITWNSLAVFEESPASLQQTQAVLSGRAVAQLNAHDLRQIKNYGEGAKELVRLLSDDAFDLSEGCACAIHRRVGCGEALQWGVLRDLDLGIHGVDYRPPHHEELGRLAREGFAYLKSEIADPRERAVALFLFMARSQFFFDANKRTASLMMNGCLMQSGYGPIGVLNRDSEEFHKRLGRFYETGNADPMMEFFETCARQIYSEQETALQ